MSKFHIPKIFDGLTDPALVGEAQKNYSKYVDSLTSEQVNAIFEEDCVVSPPYHFTLTPTGIGEMLHVCFGGERHYISDDSNL